MIPDAAILQWRQLVERVQVLDYVSRVEWAIRTTESSSEFAFDSIWCTKCGNKVVRRVRPLELLRGGRFERSIDLGKQIPRSTTPISRCGRSLIPVIT